MTQTTDTSANLDEQPTLDCSRPGELLRKARETKGLTQAEVAQKLNFLPIYIPALEDENFAPLHNATFIKGYLRAYAKFLGINQEEVLHCFAQHYPELSIQEAQQPIEIMKPEKTTNSWFFRLFSVLVVVGILAIIIFWWHSRTEQAVTSVAVEEVEVETVSGTQTVSLAEIYVEPEEELVAEEIIVEPVVPAPANPVVAKPEPETQKVSLFEGNLTEAIQANKRALGMQFTSDCWVEIRDGRGKLLHSNLMQAGQELFIEGARPYNLILGNGHAATIYYKGAEYDFNNRIRSNGYASVTLN